MAIWNHHNFAFGRVNSALCEIRTTHSLVLIFEILHPYPSQSQAFEPHFFAPLCLRPEEAMPQLPRGSIVWCPTYCPSLPTEPRAPWDHTHEASYSISDLLKPSKPIAPAESSSWGDYAIQGEYQNRGQSPDPTHSEGHHRCISSIGPYHYLIISLLFVFTYYISIYNSMFWCFIFWDWMYCMIIYYILFSQINI